MLADRLRMAATSKGAPPGQIAYTTPGGYTFVVPAGVTSISVLCIGGGAGCVGDGSVSGQGGTTSYVNNAAVTPGQSIQVGVAAGRVGAPTQIQSTASYLSGICQASSGNADVSYIGPNIGTFNLGGAGGDQEQGAGGGAGGYAGAGGKGGDYNENGYAGATSGGGGGGGGGGDLTSNLPPNPGHLELGYEQRGGAGGGGGVGLLGIGSTGGGGALANGGVGGQAGSSGGGGYSGNTSYDASPGSGGAGGLYGGGGGSGGIAITLEYIDYLYEWQVIGVSEGADASGANGAVRIMWGTGRSYPSNAANV